MADRKSFLVYFDSLKMLRRMSDEKRGKFFLAMVEYADEKKEPSFDDESLWLAWDLVQANLDRDYDKWMAMCKRNRDNGKLGGKPKRTQSNPVGSSGGQSNPHEPDTEIDTDKDTDIYYDEFANSSPQLWKKRPKACEEEQWDKYLTYSLDFLQGRQDELGKIVRITNNNISAGAVTLDNLIRVKGYDKVAVDKVIKWAINDSFWTDQVRSIGSLNKKARNGEIKFDNIYTAMKRELTGGM